MNRLIAIPSLVIFVLLGGPVHNDAGAQVGTDRADLWTFETPTATDVLESVVQISVEGAVGTGTIICVDTDRPIGSGFSGYCLTANHVVADVKEKTSIRVTYPDGKASQGCRVVAHDAENDVALLWVWVPQGVYPVPLADRTVFHGDPLLFSGLGGGSTLQRLRYFRGWAAPPTNDQKIFANVSLLPGDSGGPVFNLSGQLVGVISGGWLWFDPNRGDVPKVDYRPTWPGRACNIDSIKKLLLGTDVCPDGKCRERLEAYQFVSKPQEGNVAK